MRKLLVLCLFIGCAKLQGQTILQINDSSNHYMVGKQADYLIDSTQHFRITDIQKDSVQTLFEPIKSGHIVLDHLDDYLWVRVTIQNDRTVGNESWYFESWGFDLDEFSFYVPSTDSSYEEYHMGYDFPFDSRSVYHKNFNFLLDIRSGEMKTYYIRIKRSYPMQFSFHIRTNKAFIFHALNEYLFLGVYYGFLFLVLSFGIYLMLKLKDRLYIYFSLLIAATLWYSFSRDGLGFQYLWPSFPAVNYFARQRIAEMLLVISTLAFSSRLINNIGDYSTIKRLFWVAIGLKFLIFMYEETFALLDSKVSFSLSLTLLGIPFLASCVAQIRRKQFLWLGNIAFLSLFLSFIQVYASHITIFSNLVINWYLFNAGILIEISFFSLSIISQIVYLRRQNEEAKLEKIVILQENNRIKDELNTKLEAKVTERTHKIESLAKDLADKNDELRTKNLKLGELNQRVLEMNKVLNRNNTKLKIDIDDVTKARVLMKGMSFDEFKKVFSNKAQCFKFLAELKWDNMYHCKKCGYNKFGEGRIAYGRRCKNCNYDESPTTYTLFHKLKFPIVKAFYMVYLINRNDADYTLNELSDILKLRRETCWSFKQKILAAMEKSNHNKDLSGWETLTLISLETSNKRMRLTDL